MSKLTNTGFSGTIVRTMSNEHNRLVHLIAGRYSNLPAIQAGVHSGYSGKTFLLHGVIYTTEHQLTVVLQCDAHAENRNPVKIIHRSINGHSQERPQGDNL